MIPTKAIFTDVVLHYKTIFGKFRQWCKDGSWQKSWESLLERNRDKIDLSSADLDGSHTVARRGGEEVGGAAHKAAQTTNAAAEEHKEKRHVVIYGYTKEELANVMKHFEDQLPEYVKINIDTNNRVTRITLTGINSGVEMLRFKMNK